MKRFTLVAAAYLALLLYCACTGNDVTHTAVFWTSAEPEADSLMCALDAETQRPQPSGRALVEMVRRLDTIAARTGILQVKARASYWKARLNHAVGADLACAEYISLAKALADSARYPYDMARFHEVDINRRMDIATRYRILHDNLEIYRAVGDSFYIAEVSNRIGADLSHICDYDNALLHYTTAHDYTARRNPGEHFLAAFNMAVTLDKLGRANECRRMVDTLAESAAFDRSDPQVAAFLATKRYRYTGKVDVLKDAMAGLRHIPQSMQWVRPYLSSQIMEHYARKGILDSAARYDTLTGNAVLPGDSHYADILRSRLAYCRAAGMVDTARALADRLASYELIDQRNSDAVAVRARQLREHIALVDSQKRRSGHVGLFVLVVAIAATGIAMTVVIRRLRRRQLIRENELRHDIDQKNRRLYTAEMKVVERDRTLSGVLDDVRKMGRENSDVAAQTSKIMTDIRSTVNGVADWDRFSLLFNDIEPHFVENLTAAYPALTPTDIRLAKLILIGLETRLIARLLDINPDSVKKGRQRLRAKLSLPSTSSLSAYLATFR